MHSLFIFRRDLRLDDNTALNEALERSETVSCVFILDPRQAKPENEYFSANAFAFMVESLIELETDFEKRGGRLAIIEGRAPDVVAQLLEDPYDAVFVNRDVTPFSKKRDEDIRTECEKRGCAFHSYDDVMLNPPESVLTNEKPYRVFTPYWKAARERDVRAPRTTRGTFGEPNGMRARDIAVPEASPQRTIKGGRREALRILTNISRYHSYKDERDTPSEQGTTRLSAHLKFGTISPRELVHAIRRELSDHELERQLYWRDFYHQLLAHHPHVLGREFDRTYEGIEWSEPGERFEAWKSGRTGFPIVDAGMRELARTGWMHNRVRMITASFLTKDLHIDWREGEKHFARNLVDYDPANNNGGWQWAASTGADAAPYFRIFNPWLQQKRFDPQAAYIKQWIGELAHLSAREIHALENTRPDGLEYPEPIVDHAVERAEAIARYKSTRGQKP